MGPSPKRVAGRGRTGEPAAKRSTVVGRARLPDCRPTGPGVIAMQLLNRLSIRSKLYAGFAIVSAALLVAVAVGWMSMLSVSGTVQTGYEKAVTAQSASKW